jgi:hypothetical protein
MRFPIFSDLPRRTEPLHLALTVSVPKAISGQTKRLRQEVAAHLDANQGPIGQAHFAETVFPPEDGAMEQPTNARMTLPILMTGVA